MFALYPFQADAIAKTHERLGEGHRPIVCAPTGAGKTVIAGQIAKDAIERGKRDTIIKAHQKIHRPTPHAGNGTNFCVTRNQSL